MQLGMREEGDRRLASVYKPEKRGKLGGEAFRPWQRGQACCGHGQRCHEPQQVTLCLW